MTELIHAPVTSKEIGEVSKRDPIISNVIDFVFCGRTTQTIFFPWKSISSVKVFVRYGEIK